MTNFIEDNENRFGQSKKDFKEMSDEKRYSDGILIKSDGTTENIKVGHYSDVQLAVGGYMETVAESQANNMEWGISGRTMEPWAIYGNEIGRICTPPLPENTLARWLVSIAQGCSVTDVLTMHGDFVVLGLDASGEWTSIDPMVQLVTGIAREMFDNFDDTPEKALNFAETLTPGGHASTEDNKGEDV